MMMQEDQDMKSYNDMTTSEELVPNDSRDECTRSLEMEWLSELK